MVSIHWMSQVNMAKPRAWKRGGCCLPPTNNHCIFLFKSVGPDHKPIGFSVPSQFHFLLFFSSFTRSTKKRESSRPQWSVLLAQWQRQSLLVSWVRFHPDRGQWFLYRQTEGNRRRSINFFFSFPCSCDPTNGPILEFDFQEPSIFGWPSL